MLLFSSHLAMLAIKTQNDNKIKVLCSANKHNVALHVKHDHQYHRNCKSLNIIWCIVWFFSAFIETLYFFINPAVSEANMVDTCKHFEIGSGSVRSLSHLPVLVIEHLCRAKGATNTKQIK